MMTALAFAVSLQALADQQRALATVSVVAAVTAPEPDASIYTAAVAARSAAWAQKRAGDEARALTLYLWAERFCDALLRHPGPYYARAERLRRACMEEASS